MAAIAVYLPPVLNADQVRCCLRDVNDAIVHIKNKYKDPYLLVGGDFNKKDLSTDLADHKEIDQLLTGPTRGTNILDILATNFNDLLDENGVTEPIVSEVGIPTDYLTVFASFKMSRVPQYRIQEFVLPGQQRG